MLVALRCQPSGEKTTTPPPAPPAGRPESCLSGLPHVPTRGHTAYRRQAEGPTARTRPHQSATGRRTLRCPRVQRVCTRSAPSLVIFNGYASKNGERVPNDALSVPVRRLFVSRGNGREGSETTIRDSTQVCKHRQRYASHRSHVRVQREIDGDDSNCLKPRAALVLSVSMACLQQ